MTVVYSAIYGGYDEPKPLPPDRDFIALMITDSSQVARQARELGWVALVHRHYVTTANGNPAKLGPMLAHKWWKTHPAAAAKLVTDETFGGAMLWVDGSIQIVRPDYGAQSVAALGTADMALTPHPWRDCAIAEGRYSATLPRYEDTPVGRQTEFYADTVQHPPGWGLFASGALAWRVNDRTAAFGEWWWRECLTWSHQDQVSLPVLLRLAQQGELPDCADLTWNTNLRWEEWWILNHHKIAP